MKKNFVTIAFVFFALAMVFGIIGLSDKSNTVLADAATAPYNTPNSTNGVRIDGWRVLRNMETYGRNNDNGCGMTAMAVLLQFYNDNSRYSGEILSDDFNYAFGTNSPDQGRANALRGYSLNANPPNGYVAERNDDLFRLTPRFLGRFSFMGRWFGLGADNATVPENHAFVPLTSP